MEPGWSVVEAGVFGVLVAGEDRGVVGVEGGDEQGSGFVGVLGDAADEGEGLDRGGDEEFLAFGEVEADADGNLGEAIEFLFKGEAGEGSERFFGCGLIEGCWCAHGIGAPGL